MHYRALIIIPKKIYEKGDKAITRYIEDKMAPYDENLEVDPYIIYTKAELQNLFEDFKKNPEREKYNYSIETFCSEWHGYELDEHGNAISTHNPEGFWDWYVVGGRWDGELTGNCDETNSIKNNSTSVYALSQKYVDTKEEYEIILCDVLNIPDNKTQYKRTLDRYIDDYVVAIDYHD